MFLFLLRYHFRSHLLLCHFSLFAARIAPSTILVCAQLLVLVARMDAAELEASDSRDLDARMTPFLREARRLGDQLFPA